MTDTMREPLLSDQTDQKAPVEVRKPIENRIWMLKQEAEAAQRAIERNRLEMLKLTAQNDEARAKVQKCSTEIEKLEKWLRENT